MAAAEATGKVTVKLLTTNNETFTEQPFLTNYNFLQDDRETAEEVATNLKNGLAGFISAVTDNSYIATTVTYEVTLDLLE